MLSTDRSETETLNSQLPACKADTLPVELSPLNACRGVLNILRMFAQHGPERSGDLEPSSSLLKRQVRHHYATQALLRLTGFEPAIYRLKAGCHTAWLQTQSDLLFSYLLRFSLHDKLLFSNDLTSLGRVGLEPTMFHCQGFTDPCPRR